MVQAKGNDLSSVPVLTEHRAAVPVLSLHGMFCGIVSVSSCTGCISNINVSSVVVSGG